MKAGARERHGHERGLYGAVKIDVDVRAGGGKGPALSALYYVALYNARLVPAGE